MNPGVFLSYSRDDFKTAQQVQALLKKRGFTVCLDQERIEAGENWPKAIGESIAHQTVLMLLWSKFAAKAHLVEFEWNTALALKKKIIPVLLDNTPLPPALQTIQALEYDALSGSVNQVQEQIQRAAKKPVAPQKAVLDKLKEIQAQSPQAVLAKAKSIYQQEGWAIQGNVYQVNGGNITIQAPSGNAATGKKWYELWQTYIALVAGGMGILMTLLDLPKKWREAFPTKTEQLPSPTKTDRAIETDTLKGTILQEDKVQAAPTKTRKLASPTKTDRAIETDTLKGTIFQEDKVQAAPTILNRLASAGIDFSVAEADITDWLNNPEFTSYPAIAEALLKLLNQKSLRRPVYMDEIVFNYENSPGNPKPRRVEDVDIRILETAVVEEYKSRYSDSVSNFLDLLVQ